MSIALESAVPAVVADDVSFAEAMLWKAERLGSSTLPFVDCVRTLSVAVRMGNVVSTRALAASVDTLVRRHEVLRSAFTETDGVLSRHYPTFSGASLQEVDVRTRCAREWPILVRQGLTSHALNLFDLSRGPLWRASLFQGGEKESVFALTVHHIVFDLWSQVLLLRELSQCYAAYSTGREPALRRPRAVYRDYVQAQRGALQGARGRELVRYWTTRLKDVPELVLPRDVGCEGAAHQGSAVQWFTPPADECQRLETTGRRCRVTPATAVLAVLMLFLYRAGGCDDLTVGVPVSDRRRSEFTDVIGLFTNVVVVRAQGLRGLTFLGLLQKMAAAMNEAYAHQDLPYGYLLQVLDAREPLYRVLFNFLPSVDEPVTLTGTELERIPMPSERRPQADISLIVRSAGGAFKCGMLYGPHIFSDGRVQQFARQFQLLMSQAVNAPGRGIDTYVMET